MRQRLCVLKGEPSGTVFYIVTFLVQMRLISLISRGSSPSPCKLIILLIKGQRNIAFHWLQWMVP